jgi:Ribosomally synthesized peptide prototyped by Frankia Franean1_4349.
MSQTEIERLLGRLITDADFRVRVARSLEHAVRKEGFTLSKEEMSLLYDSDFSQFDLVGATLNDSIRRT